MGFFDKIYWTRNLPAVRLLESLFVRNKCGGDYKNNVLVTSDEEETLDFLRREAPRRRSQQLRRLKSLVMLA